MIRNLIFSLGCILLSPLYPAIAFATLYVFFSLDMYAGSVIARFFINTICFSVSGVIIVGLYAYLIKNKALLFWGYCCSITSILYWYVLRPVIYEVNNVLSDNLSVYTLVISTFFPVVFAFLVQKHLTSSSSGTDNP